MEVQAAQGFGGEIQVDTKEADKPEPVHGICGKGTEAKLGNQRVDKLFCVRLYENGNERCRRAFANKIAGNYLEAMESSEKAAMGIAETGNRKRPGEADSLYGRPLSMGSDENMCSQGNLKRKAVTGRAYQMLRLLLRTSCFEVMLNRRMPNGMYGGVRGEVQSPLLDYVRLYLDGNIQMWVDAEDSLEIC